MIDYEFLNFGHSQTAVLVPGWGMDGHIFPRQHDHKNLLLFHRYNPFALSDMVDILQAHALYGYDFLGFSMGAFAVSQLLASTHLNVKTCTFIGACRHYPPRTVRPIKKGLRSNPEATMSAFYRSCCQPDTYHLFKSLFESYVKKLDVSHLLQGLDYLQSAPFEIFKADHPIRFIHGQHDSIAPLADAEFLAQEMGAELSIVNTGHLMRISELI